MKLLMVWQRARIFINRQLHSHFSLQKRSFYLLQLKNPKFCSKSVAIFINLNVDQWDFVLLMLSVRSTRPVEKMFQVKETKKIWNVSKVIGFFLLSLSNNFGKIFAYLCIMLAAYNFQKYLFNLNKVRYFWNIWKTNSVAFWVIGIFSLARPKQKANVILTS